IVAVAAQRDCTEILLEGLRRLEYRGYDSAGFALIDRGGSLSSHKCLGRVAALEDAQAAEPIQGGTGIAHTRWATHGEPSVLNAHPHIVNERVALVHNGIIENHGALREALSQDGLTCISDTDTEVVAQLIGRALLTQTTLLSAVQQVLPMLEGAYALAIVDREAPDTVVLARQGSPLVLGVGIGEHFAGSDTLALRSVTDTFIYLEDGDVAEIAASGYRIFDQSGHLVERVPTRLAAQEEDEGLGEHEHFMRKEIFEQPARLRATVAHGSGVDAAFGEAAATVFPKVGAVQILACGTSYHAGLVARHWIESLAGLPCQVEVASEYRYRDSVTLPNTLVVGISQSGETADTLAALEHVDVEKVLARLAICNVDHSAMVRASELVYLTQAGAEIGVASTKAFTTQLAALLNLTRCLARHHAPEAIAESEVSAALEEMASAAEAVLEQDDRIRALSHRFTNKHHALFLGRGIYHPVAMEGALKLKEISYIHAEAYPAGELKHGPLALVDEDMPVVAVAPDDRLMEKLRSNLEEVRARGGQLFVFADENAGYESGPGCEVLAMPACSALAGPIVFTIALQLLSYHVALARGTDVDKPRNLAKSVTVE
ncbi:MAG: glutamine--fructose-6-phosphate transaminase (isomerizing), partial [Proteobacteria bacterium]|nr:glutamine--fructose-6-phosphate transaminase (isomerizing) [Pseudomonadota bacterium]